MVNLNIVIFQSPLEPPGFGELLRFDLFVILAIFYFN